MIKAITLIVGGLGFLLYGMKLMSSGVQKCAGESLQKALNFMTGNRFVGLLTGLIVTMIIQSSGATTAMVVSFVNAGLLTLVQSIGVTFGANIGTTITAWIVTLSTVGDSAKGGFSISALAVPMFGIGFFMTLVKKGNWKHIGEAIMGFGLLFLGLDDLKAAFSFDASQFGWLEKIQNLGVLSIFISVFLGIGVTALMHSSSAFSAIVITMATSDIITWRISAALILGASIGSTIDAVLASVGTCANARRAALVHVLYNVFGVIIVLIIFDPFLKLIELMTPNGNMAVRISAFLTTYKVFCSVIFIPFVKEIAKFTTLIIKDDKETVSKTYHLDFHAVSALKGTVAGKVTHLEKEVADMDNICMEMFESIKEGISNPGKDFIENHMQRLMDQEDYCDQMQEQMINYVAECKKLDISDSQRKRLNDLVQIIDDLEAITDICYAAGKLIQKSVERNMKFQQEDLDKLVPYIELAKDFMELIHTNLNKKLDKEQMELATQLENNIDDCRRQLRKLASSRLEEGKDVKSELLYMDLIKQIEHIGDHAFNIAGVLAMTK